MRAKLITAATWIVLGAICFGAQDGFEPAEWIWGVFTLLFLALVVIPWIYREIRWQSGRLRRR